MLLALGSMALALAATAVVTVNGTSTVDHATGGISRSGPGAATVLLTALIWVVVALINVAYARRQQQ